MPSLESPVPRVGDSWNYPTGTKTIVQEMPDGRFAVADSNVMARFIMSPADVQSQQRVDAANIAFHAKQDAARAREAEVEREAADTNGYAEQFEPMRASRVRAALRGLVRRNGATLTIRDLIRTLVASGWRVSPDGKRLVSPDAFFLTARQITGTGLQYAAHLANLIAKHGTFTAVTSAR